MNDARASFDDLQRDPERGVLAILSIALAIARFTLIATDPTVWREPRTPASPDKNDMLALVAAIDVLAHRIDSYVVRLDDVRGDDNLAF